MCIRDSWCVENRGQKSSILLQGQKKYLFSGLGEGRVIGRRGRPLATYTTDPPDIFETVIRHLNSLVMPDTKRIDRGLILCRDRRAIVA